MPTPSLQTLVTDAQAVLALQNMTTIRSTLAVALANANTGTPLNPGLTNQQLINEARQVMTLPKSDIESIIVNQLMKFLNSPPAPGGAGANKQVIWNDAGTLTGAAGLIYDGPSERLTVGQQIDIWKGLLGDSTSVAVGRSALSLTQAGATGNTAIGNQAGQGITTGGFNIAIGYNAQLANPANITGTNNIAIGQDSMRSLSAITNNANIGIGVNTLRGLSTGLLNIAIGSTAGRSITSAQSSIAIGNNAQGNAAASAITGSFNIAIGDSSMFSSANISGGDNVGIGRDTFRAVSSGASNVGIGLAALFAVTTGSNNVAIGNNAGAAIASANGNVVIGNGAGLVNTASDNVAIGINSLGLNTTGTNQTAVGRQALNVATGSNNTAFGSGAGSNITSGTNNICIGVSANVSGATNSNELVIGSNTSFVATMGAATTYYNTATAGAVALPAASLGFIRIYLNGSFVKIPVYGN